MTENNGRGYGDNSQALFLVGGIALGAVLGILLAVFLVGSLNSSDGSTPSEEALSPGFYYINGIGQSRSSSEVYPMFLVFDEERAPSFATLNTDKMLSDTRAYYVPKTCFTDGDNWALPPRMGESFELLVGGNNSRRCNKVTP